MKLRENIELGMMNKEHRTKNFDLHNSLFSVRDSTNINR